MEAIDLGEFFLIAAGATGRNAPDLQRESRVELAISALNAPFAGFGDVELYPTLAEKAAILCSRIQGYQPLPDGNKRTALLAMIEFVERNGGTFDDTDQDHVGDLIEDLAKHDIDEAEFVRQIEPLIHGP